MIVCLRWMYVLVMAEVRWCGIFLMAYLMANVIVRVGAGRGCGCWCVCAVCERGDVGVGMPECARVPVVS